MCLNRLAEWSHLRGHASPAIALMALEAHRIAVGEEPLMRLRVHDTAAILDVAAGLLFALGYEDEAKVLQRRAVAAAYLAVPVEPDPTDRALSMHTTDFVRGAEAQLRDMGGELPPSPDRHLVFGSNEAATTWLPGWTTAAEYHAAGPEGQQAIEARIDRENREYLDTVAPLAGLEDLRSGLQAQLPAAPDFPAILAETRGLLRDIEVASLGQELQETLADAIDGEPTIPIGVGGSRAP
jgi:hypothetical protein